MKPVDFEEAYSILEASFPESERRVYTGQKALLAHPNYRLCGECDESGRVTAVLAAWEFPDFCFVEHLATRPDQRGSGLGGELMSAYLRECRRLVVLEVELPNGPLEQRRIGFYERLGFRMNPFAYTQPPLREWQEDLPLRIMSYPDPLEQRDFLHIREVLYRQVYRISWP